MESRKSLRLCVFARDLLLEKRSPCCRPPRFHFWFLVAALGCSLGCRQELHTTYGQRSGPGATDSVNGTVVFAEMFEAAGHRVSSWTSLSPRLDQADCIVWFPDDFQPPGRDVAVWFEGWLAARPHRTLIYVGRDFDAATWYWKKMEATAAPSQRQATADLHAAAESDFQSERGPACAAKMGRWFDIRYGAKAGPVGNVTGDDLEWLQNIDPSQVEIELNSQVAPRIYMEALLGVQRGPARWKADIGQSQLLVVANGSFLLNATLVNHEHRKLAGKLVDAIGPSGRDVVFLESRRITLDDPNTPESRRRSLWQSNRSRAERRLANSGNSSTIRRACPSAARIHRPTSPTAWNCSWSGRPIGFSRTLSRSASFFASGSCLFSACPSRKIRAVPRILAVTSMRSPPCSSGTADRKYAMYRVQHYQQIVKRSEQHSPAIPAIAKPHADGGAS